MTKLKHKKNSKPSTHKSIDSNGPLTLLQVCRLQIHLPNGWKFVGMNSVSNEKRLLLLLSTTSWNTQKLLGFTMQFERSKSFGNRYSLLTIKANCLSLPDDALTSTAKTKSLTSSTVNSVSQSNMPKKVAVSNATKKVTKFK